MKYTFTKITLVLFSVVLFLSCDSQQPNPGKNSVWADENAWFNTKTNVTNDKIDLIYLVSTNVISAQTETGNVSYIANLSPEDRQALDAEFAYVEKNIGQSDFNYFAPYYHQFTFDALNLPTEQFTLEYNKVVKEVCEAFDYYMEYKNQGRRFALVGFSQGGMLVLDLLKHMTDKQYEKMVAAYAIGYRISADDLNYKNIIPATDEKSIGVTISYNSVLSPDATWKIVGGGAVTCINPINWTTDDTPATFTFDGCLHTVHVDPATHQLIVETDNAENYRQWNNNPVYQSANVSLDCLHHWDLLFYTDYIHDNILKRTSVIGQ